MGQKLEVLNNTNIQTAWNRFAQRIAGLRKRLYVILTQEDQRMAKEKSDQIRKNLS